MKIHSAKTNIMKNLKLLETYDPITSPLTPPSLCPPWLLRCAGRTARRPSSQSPPRPCLRRGCCCCGRGSAVTLRHSALPQTARSRLSEFSTEQCDVSIYCWDLQNKQQSYDEICGMFNLTEYVKLHCSISVSFLLT